MSEALNTEPETDDDAGLLSAVVPSLAAEAGDVGQRRFHSRHRGDDNDGDLPGDVRDYVRV